MEVRSRTLAFFACVLIAVVSVFWTALALGEDEISEPEVPGETRAENEGDTEEADAEAGDRPVLDATTVATPRYLPVTFASHDAHAGELGLACRTCHHEMAADDQEPAACSACHDQSGAAVSLTEAMHGGCRGCHRRHRAENEGSSAPVACLECHTQRN